MPSRKQRRRQLKEKRHEYEFVYVDADGNELDEIPEGLEPEPKERAATSRNGSKPAAKKQQPPQRGARRTPPVPSWNRALKRGGLLGVVVAVLFSFTMKGHLARAVGTAVIYTILFVPFTYMIDRFAYSRYQQRQGNAPPAAKKKR